MSLTKSGIAYEQWALKQRYEPFQENIDDSYQYEEYRERKLWAYRKEYEDSIRGSDSKNDRCRNNEDIISKWNIERVSNEESKTIKKIL
jgi:hypothetical protein